MDTALWIVCGLAAAALGYLGVGRLVRAWTRQRCIALAWFFFLAGIIRIFCVDIGPPQGTTTLRIFGDLPLTFWPATLMFMLHMGLIGGMLQATGAAVAKRKT